MREKAFAVQRQRFTDLNHLSLSLDIGSFHSEVLNWGFFEPVWWRNYLHVHSFFEICYVFQGKGLFRIVDTDYIVQEGEVFVARPGEIHEIISSTEEPLGIYFWSYTLIPQPSRSEKVTAVNALLDAFLQSQCPVSARTTAILRTLELLTEESAQHEPGYIQAIEGLIVKLFLDIARACVNMAALPVTEEQPSRQPGVAIAQTIVHYLRDNYNRALHVRDLAAQVHLSERHTNRIFHKIMGVSIMDYLASLRMEIATQRLLDREIPIKEVAQESGYPDVRHFTTLFKKKTGLTPAVFRQGSGTRFIHLDGALDVAK